MSGGLLMLTLLAAVALSHSQSLETADATHVIVFQMNDLRNFEKEQTTLVHKFKDEIEILHATKKGLLSLHVGEARKEEVLHHITQDIPNINIISVERVPDIQIEDGWKDGRHKRSISDFNLESYNTYPSIYEFLEELAATYPKICELETIGTTVEGRDIKVIRIHGANRDSLAKVRVFIDGAQHAREWISPAVLTYFTHELVTSYNRKEDWIVKLLDKYEFNIVPILNPDGYEYTYNVSGGRFWRKNRKQDAEDIPCFGVDLNRNWGFHWSGHGASPYKCSDIYHGLDAFSERETKAASDYIAAYSGSWHSYFSFHSFGQMILFPWSHSSVPNPHHFKHLSASKAMAEGIKVLNNISYAVGSVGSLLYAASGSSESWAYGRAEIPYSYTLELPDLYRFNIPKERIAPTAMEILMGFKYYFQHIEETRADLYPQLLNASRHIPTKPPTTTPASNSTTTPQEILTNQPNNTIITMGETGVAQLHPLLPNITSEPNNITKSLPSGTPPWKDIQGSRTSTVSPLMSETTRIQSPTTTIHVPVNTQESANRTNLTVTADKTSTLPVMRITSNQEGATHRTIDENILEVDFGKSVSSLRTSTAAAQENITQKTTAQPTTSKPIDCNKSKHRSCVKEQEGTTTSCQSSKCSMTSDVSKNKIVILAVRSSGQILYFCYTLLVCCIMIARL